MEGNTLSAKLLFTAVLLGPVLDNVSLIEEHQSMSELEADDGVATM